VEPPHIGFRLALVVFVVVVIVGGLAFGLWEALK
jgi:hypothetical protein